METAPAILLLVDDATLREMLAASLREEGYAVTAVADAAAAFAELGRRQQEPALILLDLCYGGRIAGAFAERYHGKAPIVALTCDEADACAAAKLGITECLALFFDLDTLLATVQRHSPAVMGAAPPSLARDLPGL